MFGKEMYFVGYGFEKKTNKILFFSNFMHVNILNVMEIMGA